MPHKKCHQPPQNSLHLKFLFFKRVSRKMHDCCRKANNHHQRRRRIIIDQSKADWLSYKKCLNIIGSSQLCSYQLITSNILSECKNFCFSSFFQKIQSNQEGARCELPKPMTAVIREIQILRRSHWIKCFQRKIRVTFCLVQ
jgi:hypothetical protein